MDRPDQRKRLRNLVKEDDQFKQTLLGAVVGHFTDEELDVYLDHESELRRRCASMLLARVLDQSDAIVARAQEGGER